MKSTSMGINALSEKLSLPLTFTIVLLLNVYWGFTLQAFGTHFEAVAGVPLLDLQNVEGILTPQEATDLVVTYSLEARTLYWGFFILDNLMPPIVFGSIALLWAHALRQFSASWVGRLSTSPLVLLPLGVGLFDCLENLCFVLAMASDPQSALPIMQLGIAFVWLKVVFLFLTFGLTPLLLGAALINTIRKRVVGRRKIGLAS